MANMDFFGHQERARKSTRYLVVLFVLAVVAIVTSIYFAATALLVISDHGRGNAFDWQVLVAVTAVTLFVIALATLFKTAQLRSGGAKVATLLGGIPVSMDTADPKERMLRNLVEEMAIASGVPAPEIYVLDHEQGINAFAAGWSPADAAIAVTRGCLEQLDRDELQGVIAHEFSHVFHGDMRLNIRLMGVLFGIVCISTIGRIVVRGVAYGGGRSSSSNKKGGAAGIVLFGIALIVIGWLGVLFARLIQAAVSRQREYLADASAVQYTRNPRGIGLALAKIGGLGGRLASPHAEEASHMLFADGMQRYFGGAMATHPPIDERVERILPGFRRQLVSAGDMVAAASSVPAPVVAGAAGFAGETGVVGVTGARRTRPADLVAAAGDPQPADVTAARALLQQLPLELTAAAHDPTRAGALVIALLLDGDAALRARQLTPLREHDATQAYEAATLYQLVARLDAELRLPLFELTVPALRAQAAPVREQLRAQARELALGDGRMSPFEFALLRLLERHVRLPGESPQRPSGRPTSLVQHAAATQVVLSVLARAGAADGDEQAAAAAFARGHRHLGPVAALELLPRDRCDGTQLEPAVEELAGVSPLGKRNLLAACAEAAAADGMLTSDEADLLRALAAVWDCPLPLAAGSEAAPGNAR